VDGIRKLKIFSDDTMRHANLTTASDVTDPPQKWGDHRLKVNRGILDEARIHKHTYEAYKDIIKVEN
jgi:hypothetical protein